MALRELAAQYRANSTLVHLQEIQHLPPLLLPHHHILLFQFARSWLPQPQTCPASPYQVFLPWSLQFAHHTSPPLPPRHRSPTAAGGALFPRGASFRSRASLPLHELHLLLAVLQVPRDVLAQLPILPISFKFQEASFLFLALLVVIASLVMLHGLPVEFSLLVQPAPILTATSRILLVLTSIIGPASPALRAVFAALPDPPAPLQLQPSSSSFYFSSYCPNSCQFLHPSKPKIMHLVIITTINHYHQAPFSHFTIVQDNSRQVIPSLKITIATLNLLNRQGRLILNSVMLELIIFVFSLLPSFVLLATKNFIFNQCFYQIYYLEPVIKYQVHNSCFDYLKDYKRDQNQQLLSHHDPNSFIQATYAQLPKHLFKLNHPLKGLTCSKIMQLISFSFLSFRPFFLKFLLY